MGRVVRFSASVSVGVVMLVLPAAAAAATITVTGTADEFIPTGGICSLREAVETANTNAEFGGCTRQGSGAKDTIVLEGGETYTRSILGIDDTNAAGDLDVTGKLTIEVAGNGKAEINAGDLDRVIEVRPDARLSASSLVLRDGATTALQDNPGGAGILNQGRVALRSSSLISGDVPGNGCACGGGIWSFGTSASLKKVTVLDNDAEQIGAGIALSGGDLTVLDSTIDGNVAGRSGGGIYLGADAGDTVEITRTTISANTGAADFFNTGGGGVFVSSSDESTLSATNVTISGNQTDGVGGGIYGYSGNLKLNAATVTANTADVDADGTFSQGGGISADNSFVKNSIVAGNFDLSPTNPAPDCGGLEILSHTLVGLGTGCDEGGSNLATADPLLKELDDYGGSTFTRALRGGSPAIGLAGGNAPARDQRDIKRDGDPDAEAFER